MISKTEIIKISNSLELLPHVVEKDYVLGWLLWGIDNHPYLRESWLFKGGTCLRKCFFETYRYSEDLDFTLTNTSHVDEGFLWSVFSELTNRVYRQSAIEFPINARKVEIYHSPIGRLNCQVRVGYQGPVSPRGRNVPRIKLDLTADECVVLQSERNPVIHPYNDSPDKGFSISTYSYVELFGEKVRALADRARPRDLYDVINLYRNTTLLPTPEALFDVLVQKCAFKQIEVPGFEDVEAHRALLENSWEQMLVHQLSSVPSFSSYWSELVSFFDWLYSRTS